MSMIINPYMFGGGGGGGDPYWANVVSLLNMGGADGSTSFPDSTGLRSWTGSGGVQVDTSLGYNAALFDGSDDFLSTPHATDLVLGSQDFCIEGFVRAPDVTSPQCLIEKRGTGFTTGDWTVFINAGIMEVYSADISPSGVPILTGGSMATNTEYHWAWTREGTEMRFFTNGVQTSGVATGASIASSAEPLVMGRDAVGGGRFWLNGHVRASRLTVGAARYTANFTPPAAPFPNS